MVKHLASGKIYAMKVQDKAYIAEKNLFKYAKQEQRILALSIGYPFIVQMKESFQTAAKLFLVLEYCPCGNLRRILRKQRGDRLTEHQARVYVSEIAMAIEYLH